MSIDLWWIDKAEGGDCELLTLQPRRAKASVCDALVSTIAFGRSIA
jgi:hypothetical protein